jgi:hypothetical protein
MAVSSTPFPILYQKRYSGTETPVSYLSGNKKQRKLFSFSSTFFFIIALTLSTATYAQLPGASSCTSNDLELVGATVSGDLCNPSVPGTPITKTLILSINNTTGSDRTAFAFWGTLEILQIGSVWTHEGAAVVFPALYKNLESIFLLIQ